MLLRYIHVEVLKLRRSLALLLCTAAPACVALLGTLILLDRGGSWQVFTMSNAAFWSFGMLPLALTALSVLLAQMEHGGRTWDHLLALPQARRYVFLAKALVMLGLLAAMTAWLFVLLHLAGAGVALAMPGLLRGTAEPGATALLLAKMAAASILVAVLQLWVALRSRSFVPPLVLGILGTFVAIAATSAKQGAYFPWLLATNVLATQPERATGAILLGSLGGLVALALMLVHLGRRDRLS